MNEDLFYERIRNVSGVAIVDADAFTPSYGSSVSFEADNLRFDTNDGYFQLVPNGINSLKAKFNLKYQVDEDGARSLANYYENSEGTKPVIIKTDSSIYRDITGYCADYTINHINNQSYEFNASLEVLEAPGNLNWRDLNYLNYDFVRWEYNKSYKEHDVVYAEVNDIKLNNFYYCTADHVSSVTNSPIEDGSPWTQEFSWNPDVNTSTSVTFDNEKFGFGYSLYSKTKKNTALLPLNYNFSNISTNQLKSMIHFLESRGGYMRFKHQVPSVYNRPKVYYCDSWSHSMAYDDSHNLQVSFQEDPLGVVPRKSTVDSDIVFTVTTNVYDSAGGLLSIAGEDNPLTGSIPANYADENLNVHSLEIGLSCTNIEQYAFWESYNLSGELKIPYSVKTIGNRSFGSDSVGNGLNFRGDLVIPDSVEFISNSAFRWSKFDGGIKLGSSLTGIGVQAFRGISNVTGDLVIPDLITTINNASFYGLNNIDSITIPSGVTFIDTNAFNSEGSPIELDFLRIKAPTPPSVGSNIFGNRTTLDNILYVPSGASGAYNSAGAPWTDFIITEDLS